MRRLLPLILALFCIPAAPSALALPGVGESPPAWTGEDGKGGTVAFDPARMQRPAVVLFWATWCPFCKRLMPHLQAVLDEAGHEALDVYALSLDDEEDRDPAEVLAERGQSFTLVVRAQDIAKAYGAHGTPVLLLVGRDGRVDYVRPNRAAPEQVAAALRAALGLAPRG